MESATETKSTDICVTGEAGGLLESTMELKSTKVCVTGEAGGLEYSTMEPKSTQVWVTGEAGGLLESTMEMKSTKVCVTGGAGYIGSWLVKMLLDRGHVVHATLRNLGDHAKTGLLQSLPGANTRLFLFEADLYDAGKFEAAIQGCKFVFLVATPFQHNTNSSQYKDTTEAAVAAIERIITSCERSGSVKRVIYTGSVTASSPLKEDGTGFKDSIDESCWTPLNLSYKHCKDPEKGYTISKTLAEKKALSMQVKNGVEVVSLACGLVGGDTLLDYLPLSVQNIVSSLTGDTTCHRQLKFLQALLGSVPLVHIDDVCRAHAFCMERPSMAGRFLCTSANPSMQEFVDYYEKKYPELTVNIKEVEGTERRIECISSKLADMGFKYSYEMKQILDDSVECSRRLGGLKEVPKGTKCFSDAHKSLELPHQSLELTSS